MRYKVYEVFPDGKRFFRFESDDFFDCEVYVNNHICERTVSMGLSKLVIEE